MFYRGMWKKNLNPKLLIKWTIVDLPIISYCSIDQKLLIWSVDEFNFWMK